MIFSELQLTTVELHIRREIASACAIAYVYATE